MDLFSQSILNIIWENYTKKLKIYQQTYTISTINGKNKDSQTYKPSKYIQMIMTL